MATNYQQITFFCDKNTAEMLSEVLAETHALSVSLLDAEDEPIFEPNPGEMPLWSKVKLIALFSDVKAWDETLHLLNSFLSELPPFEIEVIAERDWVSETQAQFQPQCFADKLWVYPAWYELPTAHANALRLAPGLGFGTGNHPTTQMCLEALSQAVSKDSVVLDYGCGSGILGLAALKLTAKKVYCVDIDPQALESTHNNAALNEIDMQQLTVALADELPEVQVDIIVANILAEPLMSLKPIFQKHLKANGKLILAGLLESQACALIAYYSDWFTLTYFKTQEEWACLVNF